MKSSPTTSLYIIAACGCFFFVLASTSLYIDYATSQSTLNQISLQEVTPSVPPGNYEKKDLPEIDMRQSSRESYWREFVQNDSMYITYNINWNLTGSAQEAPLKMHKTAKSIDLVSLCVKEDFLVLFQSKGMLTFFRHIQNIHSLTLLGRPKELPLIISTLRQYASELEVGSAVEGSHIVVPPIHFVSEKYFKERYQKKYNCPYWQVCQQLMKVHVFDIPYLLDNVLMVDSDTAWGRDIEFVHTDGSVTYVDDKKSKKACDGNDPVAFVNTLLNPGEATFSDRNAAYFNRVTKGAKDLGCRFKYCGQAGSTGYRHILHHMLFQRDVMLSLHRQVMDLWGGDSMWEAIRNCWHTSVCRSRVSEYELYFTYVDCMFHERVREQLLPFVLAAGDCSVKEMEVCRAKGVLLKGCHDHRIGQRMGYC